MVTEISEVVHCHLVMLGLNSSLSYPACSVHTQKDLLECIAMKAIIID